MKKNFLVLLLLLSFTLPVYAEPITIRTVSQSSFTAKYNLENKEKPGLIIEMIRAIEKIDPEVKFTGLETNAPVARIEQMLVDGDIDTFFGIASTPERQNKFTFMQPYLYNTFQCLAVRANDNVTINTLDDIKKLGKDGVILVLPGTNQYTYLSSIDGLILDNGSSTMAASLMKLISNRGRFVYGSDITVFDEIENQGLQSKVKILPARFQEAPQYAVISKKASEKVVNRLQKDYQKLVDSGEINKIYKKYYNPPSK